MATRGWLHSVLKVSMVSAVLLAGCGGGGGDGVDDQGRLVSGDVKSVISNAVQASRGFVVKDLEDLNNPNPVASGTSDSNGNYSFHIKDVIYMVVLFTVPQEPSPSGLVSVAEGDSTNKDLNDVTSLACAAGVTAVSQGAVTAVQMNRARIANLEAGATQVIAQDHPDFNDQTSFSAAVQRVRDITGDGAHPPS